MTVQIRDSDGTTRLRGDLLGGAVFVGPITVNFDDAPDFSDQKIVYPLPDGGAVLAVKPVVKTAFSSQLGFINVGGATYASGDYWEAFSIVDLTDDGEWDADSAQFNLAVATPQGAIAFTSPGVVSMSIDPLWTTGVVDLYLLIAVPSAP